METGFIFIAIYVALGYWCYTIAKRKGRSVGLAIFMGIFFGLLAVIGYYIIKPTKEVQLEDAKKLVEGEGSQNVKVA